MFDEGKEFARRMSESGQMPTQKNQTVTRAYRVTVSCGSQTKSMTVRAEGFHDALKKACEAVTGWKRAADADLN